MMLKTTNTPQHRRANVQISIAAICALCASSAFSQTAVPDQAGAKKNDLQIDEIIVTARRRDENIQTVPVAITALNDALLKEQHINSAQDLANSVSGLLNLAGPGTGPNSGVFIIRGQGPSFSSAPGVVTYFADAPALFVPDIATADTIDGRPGTFLDLENVEVLKGPQGTLFGRNATGGNVMFVPKKPDNSSSGYVQVAYGNYNDRAFEGAINIPIVPDMLMVRVAAAIEDRDGFVKDVGPINNGASYQSIDYKTVRLAVVFRPMENLENYFIGRYYYSHDGGAAYILSAAKPAPGFPQLPQLLAQQQALGPWQVSDDVRNYSQTRFLQAVNTTAWTVNDSITLKNIYSNASMSQQSGVDVDGTAQGIVGQTGILRADPKDSLWTEEVQLQGKAFGGNLVYTVGLYGDSDNTRVPTRYDFQFYPLSPGNPPFDTPYQPNLLPGISPQPGYPVFTYVDSADSSRAAYAQASLDLASFSDSLAGIKLTGGYRYTKEKGRAYEPIILGILGLSGDPGSYENSYGSFSSGIDYQLNQQTLIYFSARDAFKTGGVNAQLKESDPDRILKPEKLMSYEAGIKSSFDIGSSRASLAADVFYGDYTNIQRSVSDPARAVASFSTNVAAATVQGFEFDGTLRATENLTLRMSYAYTDSKYTKVTDPSAVATLTGAPFPSVARNKVIAGANYELPFLPKDIGPISISGNYTYQSSVTYSQTNAISVLGPAFPGFGLVTLGSEWSGMFGKPVTLRLYATNLFDKLYTVNSFDFYSTAGFATLQHGPPRTYGLQLRYDFGGNH
jgi:iron complex outermembrane recepter protein